MYLQLSTNLAIICFWCTTAFCNCRPLRYGMPALGSTYSTSTGIKTQNAKRQNWLAFLLFRGGDLKKIHFVAIVTKKTLWGDNTKSRYVQFKSYYPILDRGWGPLYHAWLASNLTGSKYLVLQKSFKKGKSLSASRSTIFLSRRPHEWFNECCSFIWVKPGGTSSRLCKSCFHECCCKWFALLLQRVEWAIRELIFHCSSTSLVSTAYQPLLLICSPFVTSHPSIIHCNLQRLQCSGLHRSIDCAWQLSLPTWWTTAAFGCDTWPPSHLQCRHVWFRPKTHGMCSG